jgi:hypothetical protein
LLLVDPYLHSRGESDSNSWNNKPPIGRRCIRTLAGLAGSILFADLRLGTVWLSSLALPVSALE